MGQEIKVTISHMGCANLCSSSRNSLCSTSKSYSLFQNNKAKRKPLLCLTGLLDPSQLTQSQRFRTHASGCNYSVRLYVQYFPLLLSMGVFGGRSTRQHTARHTMDKANKKTKYTLYKPESGVQRPCAFFSSEMGCKNGANCQFLHTTGKPMQQRERGMQW